MPVKVAHISGKYAIWAAVILGIATIAAAFIQSYKPQTIEQRFVASKTTKDADDTRRYSDEGSLSVNRSFRGRYSVTYHSPDRLSSTLLTVDELSDFHINEQNTKLVELTDGFVSGFAKSGLRVMNFDGTFDKTWEVWRSTYIANRPEGENYFSKECLISSVGWIDEFALRFRVEGCEATPDHKLGFYQSTNFGDQDISALSLSGDFELELELDRYNSIIDLRLAKVLHKGI